MLSPRQNRNSVEHGMTRGLVLPWGNVFLLVLCDATVSGHSSTEVRSHNSFNPPSCGPRVDPPMIRTRPTTPVVHGGADIYTSPYQHACERFQSGILKYTSQRAHPNPDSLRACQPYSYFVACRCPLVGIAIPYVIEWLVHKLGSSDPS